MNINKLFFLASILVLATFLPIQLFSFEKDSKQRYAPISSPIPAKTFNRKEVITIIKRAIDLNENFKHAVNKDESEYQEKRAAVEKYHEEILSPALIDIARLLSTDRDVDLSFEFFNLLISYENSADEQLSYTLGEIFLKNPDLVNEVFYKFDQVKQKVIYRQLEWGFENVVYSIDKSDQTIRNRYELLQQFKSKMGKMN